jgi:PKD domain
MAQLISRRSLAFVFGLSLALHARPGTAAPVKDQAFEPTPPDTIPTIHSSLRWAQTFRVGVTGTLARVDVLVAQQFNRQPEDLEVTIYDTVGGAPHAALTAPFRIAAASVPIVIHPSTWDGYAYLSAAFALPVAAGDVLAIVVSTGPASQYYWAGVFGGGYPGGQLYRTSSTVWSGAGPEDQAFRTFVAASRPPTASAGSNQTLRPGATVNLDGGASFDDNTDSSLLQYAWSVVSAPPESAVTTLTGANTMTASFVPDVPGTYVVQLVVTDEDGLFSQPSEVTIGQNLPPTAEAGADRLVIVNDVVALTGSAEDPDGDTITYQWSLTRAPAGSTAQLVPPSDPETTFIADRPGIYVATLTPSDFVGAGTAASATITAITAISYAAIQLHAAAEQLLGLPPDALTSRGNQKALMAFLRDAADALQGGDLGAAQDALERAMGRTDGCVLRGAPDGNGPSRDWITTCEAQEQVYTPLVAALDMIAR